MSVFFEFYKIYITFAADKLNIIINMVFIIAVVAVVLWVLSLAVRQKNYGVGKTLSYIALVLLVIAVILHFVM